MNLKGKTMGIVLEAFLIGVAEVVLNFSWASASLEDFKKKNEGKCQGPILRDSVSIILDWGLGTGISESSLGEPGVQPTLRSAGLGATWYYKKHPRTHLARSNPSPAMHIKYDLRYIPTSFWL